MIFTAENTLLIGSILLFVSIVVGKTGYRFGVPTLLLFLVVGMLFGSDGLGLQFHDAKDAQFIGMVALSIILFSGGMDTKFKEIKPILGPGIVLSTVGVLLTALFTGLFIWWLSGMSWTNIYLPITTSLLLAATMSSTDSASVFAILRSQKMNLKHNLRPMLELESGSNDPMAYMLTIVLIQFIQSGGMGIAGIFGSIGSILLFISIIVGKTGYRFGVPALLLFLVVGMIFGSDGFGLQFHNAKEAQFIGMVALSVILFSGGMDTKFSEIKPILVPGIVLSTFGVLLTAVFTGFFIWWINWTMSAKSWRRQSGRPSASATTIS